MALMQEVNDWVLTHLSTVHSYETIHLDELPSRPSTKEVWVANTLFEIFETGCRAVLGGSRPEVRLLLVLPLTPRKRLWLDPPRDLEPYLGRASDMETPGIYLSSGPISSPRQEEYRFPLEVELKNLALEDYQVFFRQYRDREAGAALEPYEQIVYLEQLRRVAS